MDREFLTLFMEKTQFPIEARIDINTAFDALERDNRDEILSLVKRHKELNFVTRELIEPIRVLEAKTKISEFTIWLLIVISNAKSALETYRQKGISEEIFWDTFTDLRYKLLECKSVKGVWGTFVAHWYKKLLEGNVIKLGRLEFESRTYTFEEPYICGDLTLTGEVEVKSVHIPSAPEKFDFAARIDSYKKAYKFFTGHEKGKPMVFICHSWLLFLPYKEVLSPSSNIVDFMGDFDIVKTDFRDNFGDAWRIFGDEATKSSEDLPEKTSLQRIFKQYLMQNKPVGLGLGVIIFDGEKILNV